MTCFRIDLQQSDRAGNHPVLFDGKFIGISCDPFTSAAQWLTRHMDAKPGDTIDLRAGGVQLQYARISHADRWPRGRARAEDNPQPPARPDELEPEGDDPDDPDPSDDAEDIAETAERKRKKKQKKSLAPDDSSSSPPHDPADEDAEAYRRNVAASVAAILAADARRRGVAPPIPAESAGDDLYQRHVNASVAAIVAANNRRHGIVEPPVALPENPISRAIVRAHYRAIGRTLTE